MLGKEKDLLAVHPHGDHGPHPKANKGQGDGNDQRIFYNVQADMLPVDGGKAPLFPLFPVGKGTECHHRQNVKQGNGEGCDHRNALQGCNPAQGFGERDPDNGTVGAEHALNDHAPLFSVGNKQHRQQQTDEKECHHRQTGVQNGAEINV